MNTSKRIAFVALLGMATSEPQRGSDHWALAIKGRILSPLSHFRGQLFAGTGDSEPNSSTGGSNL
jgi:hypothetical protein